MMSDKKIKPETIKPWLNRRMPPFNQHLGFEIEEWTEGRVVITADIKPEHRNYQGLPHGGFIATMLDAATALAGVYTENEHKVRKALTLSLNINFLGQAMTSGLKAIGTVTASGKKIFYSTASVYDMKDNLIASAQGVFRYRTGSEKE